ncbi:Contactin-3 [Labeo rohita]|uniref:Contactin-3 n=1 Tax=Labeo rohita TaxID=84645 RepID=A0ABQ8MVB0_LABRO|nr:Contactin-3 [Labeo rohita]
MADKCHLCLLGLIILSSLLTGTSGVNDDHVFISSGENVRLRCNNHLHDCKSTTWNYNIRHSAAVELIGLGIKKKDIERHERLSLGSDCSLNINNIIKEDYGSYICQQYVNDKQQGTDARVFLHVLHVSSSSQTEISAGSSVTLYCQLFSYTGDSCDDWIRSEGIQLFWVNHSGVKLTISDSRYQESAPGHCIITVTTTLLNEDDNREWRCEVTHRNQVKTSVTYTVKSSAVPEISAGSSVTLYCQLFSYTGVSCDDWIRSEGIQLFWVNQAGVKLTISDSRYQISAPGHCIITLTTTLLNEDDNREWRCEVTHRNQVKTSVTYTVKSSDESCVIGPLRSLSREDEQQDSREMTELGGERGVGSAKGLKTGIELGDLFLVEDHEAGVESQHSQLAIVVENNCPV